MQFQKAQQLKWVVRIGIRSIPMFRKFHFFDPFLGPTIFENELVIHKDKESFSVVPLFARKRKKDLSEITGWVGPTFKGMGVLGHCLGL